MILLNKPSSNWIEDADPDLLRICEEVRSRAVKENFVDPTLDGWCGTCSAALALAFVYARRYGAVVMGEYYGEGHCWVHADDELYYDITASQFGEPDIVVDYPDDESTDRWNPTKRLDVVSEITVPQFFKHWGILSPSYRRIEKLAG